MRCLAFADGLSRHSVTSRFMVKSFAPRVAEVIRAHGFTVDEIAPEVSAEEDAHLTRATALRYHTPLIITDLCTRPALANRHELDLYHRLLGKEMTVVSLTGGDALDIPATIVVYPYFRTSFPKGKADNTCIQLVGPAYFIFRREFIQAAQAVRIIRAHAQQILVTIGGGDEFHLSAKVITALTRHAKPDHSLRIVIGPAYSDSLKDEITSLLAGFSGKYAILDHTTNLAEAMLWADLAITGDGLTKYETAVTGTPSLMLSRPDSEAHINREFEQAGSTRLLGDGVAISTDALAECIGQVVEDHRVRQTMSQRGKSMVDGNGLERILATIPEGIRE